MHTYYKKRRRGEPGFGSLLAFVLAFYVTLLVVFGAALVGLLFLIKAIFF